METDLYKALEDALPWIWDNPSFSKGDRLEIVDSSMRMVLKPDEVEPVKRLYKRYNKPEFKTRSLDYGALYNLEYP